MTARNPSPRPRRPPPPARPPRPSPRTITVYRTAAEVGDYLWQLQADRELTAAEMLMILIENETRLIKHLVLGDPHPSEL